MQEKTAANDHDGLLWVAADDRPVDAICNNGHPGDHQQQAIQNHLALRTGWLLSLKVRIPKTTPRMPKPVFHATHAKVSSEEMQERMSSTPTRKLISARKMEMTFIPVPPCVEVRIAGRNCQSLLKVCQKL